MSVVSCMHFTGKVLKIKCKTMDSLYLCFLCWYGILCAFFFQGKVPDNRT